MRFNNFVVIDQFCFLKPNFDKRHQFKFYPTKNWIPDFYFNIILQIPERVKEPHKNDLRQIYKWWWRPIFLCLRWSFARFTYIFVIRNKYLSLNCPFCYYNNNVYSNLFGSFNNKFNFSGKKTNLDLNDIWTFRISHYHLLKSSWN